MWGKRWCLRSSTPWLAPVLRWKGLGVLGGECVWVYWSVLIWQLGGLPRDSGAPAARSQHTLPHPAAGLRTLQGRAHLEVRENGVFTHRHT